METTTFVHFKGTRKDFEKYLESLKSGSETSTDSSTNDSSIS